MRPIPALLALLLAPSLAAPGCALLAPQKDPTRYAVLASVDELPGELAPSLAAPSTLRVGLGPVTLPEYVRRSEIVVRSAGTRILLSPTERWAEPLDRALVRVLAVDLQRALGSAPVVHHPWYASDRPDLQVEIDFARCERDESGPVVVVARWTLRDLAGGGPPVERESRIERPLEGSDGAGTALALSRALAELCREIAAARNGGP